MAWQVASKKSLILALTMLSGLALSDNAVAQSTDATEDFARTLGMGAQRLARENNDLQEIALRIQERREAVPQDLRDYYNYLLRNPLLEYLKTNPNIDLFHVLLWNHFALDMTSLDHTTKNDKDPADPKKLVIEDSYAEQLGPARSSRAMGMAHLAMFEAVNAITPQFESYRPSGTGSEDVRSRIVRDVNVSAEALKSAAIPAAVAYATYQTLARLYPSKRSILDADLEQSLILIRLRGVEEDKVETGKRIGIAAASIVFQDRANDHSQDPGANHTPCTIPMHSTCLEPRFSTLTPNTGEPFTWQPDPIIPVATQLGGTWPAVTPFVLKPHQFIGRDTANNPYLITGTGAKTRTSSPRDSDPDFLMSLNEGEYGGKRPDPRLGTQKKTLANSYGVRQYGRGQTAKRDADLTSRGIFWGYDGTALLCAPPRLYNMIATSVALSRKGHDASTAIGMARYLALVNLALADAGIAAWDGKYTFNVARPVTYIRYKSPASVHEGVTDAAWFPLGQAATNGAAPNLTPAFPAYPSGHAVFGGALFQTMSRFFGVEKESPSTRFTFVSDEYNGINHGSDGVARRRLDVTFRSFESAEWENAESRIWLGIHWQRDADDGIALGNEVADAVFIGTLKKLSVN